MEPTHDPQSIPAPPLSFEKASAAALVEAHHEKIIHRWKIAVRAAIYPARLQTEAILIDSLPVFLNRLSDALRERHAVSRAASDELVLADVHGTQRACLEEYELRNVLAEYHQLRKIIFEVLDEAGGIEAWERERIFDLLQEVIETASAAFARERESETRRARVKADRLAVASRAQYSYPLAIATAVAAVLTYGYMLQVFHRPLYFVPLAMTLVCALYLGTGAGYLAGLGSTLGVAYFFAEPVGSVWVESPYERTTLLLYLGLCIFGARLAGKQRALYVEVKTNEAVMKEDRAREEKLAEERSTHILNLEVEREMRERFVAALSHDLRNPLTAARASAQMIKRQPDNVERHLQLASRIVESLTRANRMIEDLLDANVVHAGQKLAIEVGPCDLHEVVDSAVRDLETIHGERFRVELDPELTGSWSCSALQRALENLVSNAVKYGDPTTPITIRGKLQGNHVQVSVHNWGKPLREDEQANLFQHLHRSESAKQSGHKGWGIGLTLVKGIAEAHSGTVSVNSNESAGTTFTLTLPRYASNS